MVLQRNSILPAFFYKEIEFGMILKRNWVWHDLTKKLHIACFFINIIDTK